jgi:hypothetical protein
MFESEVIHSVGGGGLDGNQHAPVTAELPVRAKTRARQ